MSQEMALVGLCELFIFVCGFGAVKAKPEKLQMNFLGAALFSAGVLFLSIGIHFVRGDIPALLFLGILLTVFGGIALIMDIGVSWLFFKDDDVT